MDIARAFLEKSHSLIVTDYLPKIERAVAPLNDADVWWRPNEQSNSIGNIVLHLCGNVTQWIIGGVGGRPTARNRQQEFDERQPLPKSELLSKIRGVVQNAGEIIEAAKADDLMSHRQIQGYDVSVLEAIYHVTEHFGMHTGQIIWIAKARTGSDLRLWEPPV
jgi:uncharacterized damage-inducible protein DinB